ncbi:hypothetical protein AGMMS50239_34490 [Bacteroidia bacterium]|nr:hypothetical protein AGMMS50239_34490 [Bacteroidia bacterium]
MSKLFNIGISVFLILLLASCRQQATVKEEKLELVTYPFGDPDPVAHPGSSFYDFLESGVGALRATPLPSSPLLEQCGNLPDVQSFYLTRAQYRQGEKKLEDLLRAEQLDKSWRAGMALIRYYQEAKQYDRMYEKSKEYTALFPENYELGLKYAAAMLSLKQYRECTDYLTHLNVLPNEGAGEGRRVYREACDLRAEDFITAYCNAKISGKKPPVYNVYFATQPAPDAVIQEIFGKLEQPRCR